MSDVALSFIVIGQDEAPHLPEVFESLHGQVLGFEPEIIYVDSGSVDGSAEIARGAGADFVVEVPRSGANAARARNAGLEQASGMFVHFVDGDTRLEPGWAARALEALGERPQLVGVEGRIREARPDAHWVHWLLERDWPADEGEVPFVGGNALYRAAPLREVGAFDERLSVGEEPELGARLRGRGHRFRRLSQPMAIHDLDAGSWRDYWGQMIGNGYSCGLVVRVTGGFWKDRLRRDLAWAGLLASLVVLPWWGPLGGGLALAAGSTVALASCRQAWAAKRAGLPIARACAYGLHVYLSKIPRSIGILSALRSSVGERTDPPA